MDGIDRLSDNYFTLHMLTQEMWIEILDYVPLRQRLEQVQFVSPMFAYLCNAPELTERMAIRARRSMCDHFKNKMRI